MGEFLSLPKDGNHGRVFSHYQRMGIMGEFTLTTKGWRSWESFCHYQMMRIVGEVSLTTKGWGSWESFCHYQRMGIVGEVSLTTKGWGSWESCLSLPKNGDHGRVFSHYQRMGIMGEFSLTTKGWGSWESFLSLPKDGNHGRVSLTTKGWGSLESFLSLPKDGDHGRVFSHYQRMRIIGEFSLNTKGWRSWEIFLSLPKDGDHRRVFSDYQRMGIMGEFLESDLRWNTHVSNVCTTANRTLGFLRRNLYSCHQEVKEAAYKRLVRPVLDYGSSVWEPPGVFLQEELESLQKRAARFVTGNYSYETGSMTGILGQLKWESLKKRRKNNRLILLYKGLKGKASVPTDGLIPKTRRAGNQHSMAFQTPIANTDAYKGSFFSLPTRDWNAFSDSLISSVLLSSLLW